MSTYYAGAPQYPPQGQAYGAQAPYQQTTPYPDQPRYQPPPQTQQYPQPYPQQQQWNSSPPPQHNNYSPAPPQQQQWNPEKIWAEANAPHAAAATNGSRAGSPFVNASRSGSPFVGAPGQPQGENGERGIGATVLGGGAGAFLGHEMGHGKLATIGGLVAGAIAANALEHHEKKKHRERDEAHAYDQGFYNGEKRDLSGSRSRGLDDDESYYERETTYDDDYEPPRHHHHHHHHDRDYDDEYVQEDSYYRRSDDEYADRRGDDYYERDSYSSRDDHRRY